MRHLSAGELLREEMAIPSSKDGELIRSCLKEGKIVPVAITLELLKRRMLSTSDPCNRFLIDGFPRNWDNVKGWEEFMSSSCEVEAVIVIECNENELQQRILTRGLTSGRSDDNAETIKKRFLTFEEATMPVIQYYELHEKVIKVNGNQDMNDVFRDIKRAVDPFIAHEVLLSTRALLESISRKDWDKYRVFADPSLTAIEPETEVLRS